MKNLRVYFSKYLMEVSWKNAVLISIYLINPFRTYNKIKNIFIPLKRYFYFGKYSPIWGVWNVKVFSIQSSDVAWKDKYDTPRYEGPPFISISLFGYYLIWYWKPSIEETFAEDHYWEQALWYLYYYNTASYGYLDAPDIERAKEGWPWYTDNDTSSWDDRYLL